MSETLARIQEKGAACITAYEQWNSEQKDVSRRESLQESLHELRKAIARVEIEVAISERDSFSSKKLPIPPHRSKSKEVDGENDSILSDRFDDQESHGGHSHTQMSSAQKTSSSSSRRPMRRKPSGNPQN